VAGQDLSIFDSYERSRLTIRGDWDVEGGVCQQFYDFIIRTNESFGALHSVIKLSPTFSTHTWVSLKTMPALGDAAYCIISDLKGRDGSLPDTPGTNGLTSNSPPQ
jgi:hypothetical protein